MKKNVRNEEMEGILSDFVKMKFAKINDLISKGDYKGLEEFYNSEELNKFQTIRDMDGMEDENGNEYVMFFDDSVEFKEYFVYTVNVKTLEVNILLIEDDYKRAERFFYGFKYSDKYFEIEDSLDEGETLMSQREDGVWVNYIQKIENNELVSSIELNKYRLNKGLRPIVYHPVEDLYKIA